MAREFDGVNQYLSVAASPMLAPPFSMACWFNSDNNTSQLTTMEIAWSAVAGHYHSLSHNATTVHVASVGAGNGQANSSGTITTGTWHHMAGVWTSTSSRAAFLDGGNKGTNSTGVTVSNVNAMSIGARAADSTPAFYFNGRIAEAAGWSVALTDDEVASLGEGACPLMIRPTKLVGYWPLGGYTDNDADVDLVGGNSMSPVNSPTTSDHPPISFPVSPIALAASEDAPASGALPMAAAIYEQMRRR